MHSELAERTCRPCQGGENPLKGQAIEPLKGQLPEGWEVVEEHHLEKTFTFEDFQQALDFTNRVGAIAEEQGHHPDLYLGYGEVRVQVWTHKIGGLSESDFIFAARADRAR